MGLRLRGREDVNSQSLLVGATLGGIIGQTTETNLKKLILGIYLKK